MSIEQRADARETSEEAACKTEASRETSSERTVSKRMSCLPGGRANRTVSDRTLGRPAMERFIERALHEAYAATLREKVPQRFKDLLDRLKASQGGNHGRA